MKRALSYIFVALAMLAAGFFLRPLVLPQQPQAVEAVSITAMRIYNGELQWMDRDGWHSAGSAAESIDADPLRVPERPDGRFSDGALSQEPHRMTGDVPRKATYSGGSSGGASGSASGGASGGTPSASVPSGSTGDGEDLWSGDIL